MRVLFFTDCMSIDDKVPSDLRYPSIVGHNFPMFVIDTIALNGMTTGEAAQEIENVIDRHPDIVVFSFGVNDALPRGLRREHRGALIRWTYKVGMSKKLRLAFRTIFLNPLEYAMQIITKPKHYFTIDGMILNIDHCMSAFHERGIKTILINIAPVLNYRFINALKYIEEYNRAIHEYCKSKSVPLVDAYSLFNDIGLEKALAKDRFHYSEASHKAVAAEVIKIINKMKE